MNLAVGLPGVLNYKQPPETHHLRLSAGGSGVYHVASRVPVAAAGEDGTGAMSQPAKGIAPLLHSVRVAQRQTPMSGGAVAGAIWVTDYRYDHHRHHHPDPLNC
ncbi:MAG: hypothetical protein WBB01_01495 [Phormidesmis sp.]